MPLLTAHGHKLTNSLWNYRGREVALKDDKAVKSLLIDISASQGETVADFGFVPGGGECKCRYRFGIGTFGSPRFFEYLFLNASKQCFLKIIGIVSYPASTSCANGHILVETRGKQFVLPCMFSNETATMQLRIGSSVYECEWFEESERTANDWGVIEWKDKGRKREICRLVGQSMREELEGIVPQHKLFSNGVELAQFYPKGRWTMNPMDWYKLWVHDSYSIVSYNSNLNGWISESPHQTICEFCLALAMSVGLHRWVNP